jgi:hypothetical protein
LFNTPGGLTRGAVANVFQYYLYCAAKIGRQKFGFGALKKKISARSPVPHLRDRDNIRGNIDIESTMVSNISSAPPSKGVQVVLNQLGAAQASQFAGLVRMTLECAKQQDYTNIHLLLVLISVIPKAFASQTLQGNFATEKVTSLELEANSVEPSVVLPQRNKCLIDQELINEMKATSKNFMDFADSRKTIGKTAIARIGTMRNMTDFSSLCINMDTIITAICSNKEPQPILWQILLKFVSIINYPEWVHWSVSIGAMPNLHWYCYTFLERIFNSFADFAIDFGNRNIMSESRPIAELNTKALVGALTVMKAFLTQINLHQATVLPIVISQSVVATYNISLWINTQSCGRPLGAKPASDAKPSPEQCCGDKHDPTTPDTANDTNSSNCQKQKKPKRGMQVDTATKGRKDLGMFYLKNPSINPSKVFPKIMPEKICENFTCKGKECSNASCNFIHPRKPSELKRKTIIVGNQECPSVTSRPVVYFSVVPTSLPEGISGEPRSIRLQ